MDIRYFNFFVTIVDCGCNLSAAAKTIHISQSALSKAILAFEAEQNTPLFLRGKGRLNGLTDAGKVVYNACQSISQSYEAMQAEVEKLAGHAAKEVTVGIPPLVLSLLFADVIAQCRVQLPQVDLLLIEAGSEELRVMLQNKEIDYAVLLAPTGLPAEKTAEDILFTDELAAFIAPSNPLTIHDELQWQDLDGQKLAVFNESFSIHRLLAERFQQENVKPVLAVKSASWDYLLDTVQQSELITILPVPVAQYAQPGCVRILPFRDPLPWQVVFARNRHAGRTAAQRDFHQFIVQSLFRGMRDY